MSRSAKRARIDTDELRSRLYDALESGSALYAFETYVFPRLDLLDWYALARSEDSPNGPIHQYIRKKRVWQTLFDREYGDEPVPGHANMPMREYMKQVFDSRTYPQYNPLWGMLAYETYLSVEYNMTTRFMFPDPLKQDYVRLEAEVIEGALYYKFEFSGPDAISVYWQMEQRITPGMKQVVDAQNALFLVSDAVLAAFLRRVYELFRHGMRLTHANGLQFGLNSKGISCSICSAETALRCPKNGLLYCSEACHGQEC